MFSVNTLFAQHIRKDCILQFQYQALFGIFLFHYQSLCCPVAVSRTAQQPLALSYISKMCITHKYSVKHLYKPRLQGLN